MRPKAWRHLALSSAPETAPGQALVENTLTVRHTIECSAPVTSWRRKDARGRWPLTAGQTTSIGR